MIKCVITGSTGVLGKKIKQILPYKFYEFKKDITKKNEIDEWIQNIDFDIVIHCAAKVPTDFVNKNYKKAYNVNVNGTKNLVNSILKKKNKPKWFFFASTSHVYKLNSIYKKVSEKNIPKPQSKYGKTKLLAEIYLQKKFLQSTTKLCIGRIFSFTDHNQKIPYVIPSIASKIKKSNRKLVLKNLNHYRDFLSTKDIVKCINHLNKKQSRGIFNIASGIGFNLKLIAKLIAKKHKKKISFVDTSEKTYLIANTKKILKLKWKPNKFKKNLNYFY